MIRKCVQVVSILDAGELAVSDSADRIAPLHNILKVVGEGAGAGSMEAMGVR